MRKWLGVVLGVSLLLTSCNVPVVRSGALLEAPLLNQQQQQLNEAMKMTLDLSEIVYKYPQRGEYRAPFVLFDIDGDSRQEAVVFYALASAPGEVRAKFMRQDKPGEWSVFHDLAGGGDQVEFVHFINLQNGSSCMVIGWKNSILPQRSSLGFYYIRDGVPTQETFENYGAYAFHDFSGSGVSDMIFATWAREGYTLHWMKAGYDRLTEAGSTPLYRGEYGSVIGVLQIIPGILWDQSPAIYVDEVLEDADTSFITYATEVLSLDEQQLNAVVGGMQGASAAQARYRDTFRDSRALSVDLQGNGIVFVPQIELLPGESDQPEDSDRRQLLKYMQLTQQGFELYRVAMVNELDGYRVFFPDRWLDRVTLVEYPETSEWRFYRAVSDSGQLGAELLRLRVYSTRDIRDDKFTEDDILLATKGVFRYYGYIPHTEDEPLAVTAQEAGEMFSLI